MSFWLTTVLAQTTPAAAPAQKAVTPEQLELVKTQLQLELQRQMAGSFNEKLGQLTNSFDKLVGIMHNQFLVVMAILGFLGAIALWFFSNTLREAKLQIASAVEQRVRQEIDRTIAGRIEYLERVIAQEQVLGHIELDYVMLGQPGAMPMEYSLLQARGFRKLRVKRLGEALQGEVVVLDLVHHGASGRLPDEAVTRAMEQLYAVLSDRVVLVVYVRDRYAVLNDVSDRVPYYTPANAPVPLMGAVVNAAYVADSLRLARLSSP